VRERSFWHEPLSFGGDQNIVVSNPKSNFYRQSADS
jgi:hypothetical protein